jgi:hypothetical protein
MSATLTPPAPAPAVRSPELVTQPSAAPSRVARPSPAVGRVREGLFFAAWASALTIAAVAAGLVLAVGSPCAAALTEIQRRRYR